MQSLSVFLDITKFPNFWWKKCWYQQNLRGVSHDLYLIFFRKCITVSSFIIVADFKGRGFYWPLPTHRWTALKRPNLNRVKQLQNEDLNFCFEAVFCTFLIDEERLSSVVVGVVNILVDKPIDFHDTTFIMSPSLFKV